MRSIFRWTLALTLLTAAGCRLESHPPPGVPAVYAQLHQQSMQAANTARTIAILASVVVFVVVLLAVGVGVAMSLLTAR